MIGQPPPFALATPEFRFRALAAHAGRAALGGDREIALASLVASRLGAALAPPRISTAADLITRAAGARQWLASISVPAQVRAAVGAAIDASGAGDEVATARALGHLFPLVARQLDEASLTEIRDLVIELAHDSSEFEVP